MGNLRLNCIGMQSMRYVTPAHPNKGPGQALLPVQILHTPKKEKILSGFTKYAEPPPPPKHRKNRTC